MGGGASQQAGEEMQYERKREGIEKLALVRATRGQPGEQRLCGRVVGSGRRTLSEVRRGMGEMACDKQEGKDPACLCTWLELENSFLYAYGLCGSWR